MLNVKSMDIKRKWRQAPMDINCEPLPLDHV